MQTERRRARGSGFSLIELLIVIAIILVILMVAVPKYNAAQMSANELAVMKAIQTIHVGQIQYLQHFQKYASTLAELGPPTSGGPGPQAADLIPGGLSGGDKNGYTFVMTITPSGYTVNANPKVYNSTGRRTFYSDQNQVLRQNWSQEPATINSGEVK